MRWTITWMVIACAMGRASAEQFVTGTAFYRMSDRDTDSEAGAIAFQRAMDRACEQAGLFEVTSAELLTRAWEPGVFLQFRAR